MNASHRAGRAEMRKEIILRIKEEIAEIEADERYSYPPADVFINAPLALIQVELKARRNAFKTVLEMLEGSE